MHRESTGRIDTDGKVIHTGDRIVDENGCEVTVFKHQNRYRVALQEHDLVYGVSASLGLYIVGGIKIIL